MVEHTFGLRYDKGNRKGSFLAFAMFKTATIIKIIAIKANKKGRSKIMDLSKLIRLYQAAVTVRNIAAEKYRQQLHCKIDHIERYYHCSIDCVPDQEPLIRDLQRFANAEEPHLPPKKRRQLTTLNQKQRDELGVAITGLLDAGFIPSQIAYMLGITSQTFWQIGFQSELFQGSVVNNIS